MNESRALSFENHWVLNFVRRVHRLTGVCGCRPARHRESSLLQEREGFR